MNYENYYSAEYPEQLVKRIFDSAITGFDRNANGDPEAHRAIAPPHQDAARRITGWTVRKPEKPSPQAHPIPSDS
jgi:hypothetical protein